MASNLELKKSSKLQRNSKILNERFPLAQAYQSLKYQGRLKVKDCVGSMNNDLPHGPRQDAHSGILIQPKTSGNRRWQCVKGKVTKDDELVKYMSNLPGYLECVERGENSQGKALNVGVLDWSRLEKWKHNQNSTPGRGDMQASSSSFSLSWKTPIMSASTSRTVSKDTLGEKHASCSGHNSSHKHHQSQGVQPSVLEARHFRESETAFKGTLDVQNKTPWNYKSFEKGKRIDLDQKITSGMENLSSNVRNCKASLSLKENASAWDGENKKRVEELQVSDTNRKASDQRITLDMVSSSSKLRNSGISLSFKEKLIAANDKTKKRVQELQGSEIDLTYQHRAGEHKNIVLLLPRKCAQNSYPEEPQLLLDESLTEARRSSFSDDFPHQEVHSTELCSQIPRCPLPFSVDTSSESDMMAQGVELSSDAPKTSTCLDKTANLVFEGKCADPSNGVAGNTNAVENTKTLSQEMAELAARKSRHPSPNRRFSFSFHRMSRSFSFKEGSAVPQLSPTYASVKSGPVRLEGSTCLYDSNREKANSHNRARSSPLRRILDPLLKSKGLNSIRSTETVMPSKGGLTSFNVRSITTNELLQNGKQDASMMQALLQLTIRNGLPLFQFMVDNNSSIFGATNKNSASLGKDDSGQHYTFYSVNEVKKRSGSWISQGPREKHCGFVYNVVGQMKLYRSHIPDLTGQDSNNQYIVRESTLFGVDLRHADHASPKFIPSRELAAIVVKMPCENLSHDVQQSDKDMLEKGFTECPTETGHPCSFGESEGSSCTSVILPGGVHSMPNKGVPSPLIDRWKSGGSCDCGGWDVGCKLRVLSNQNQCHSISKMSKVHLNSNSFELFVQRGAQMNMPIFTLVPLKNGIYSVEFDSSISMLQAFFTCVTIISCQKMPDLSEVSTPSEAKEFQEPMLNGNGQIKMSPIIIMKEAPVKYAPNPPHSPAGRV